MPDWGLTEKQRLLEPWGIPEWWLRPLKRVADPVQGTVYLNRLETAIADSSAMQRLRYVRQLGTAHYVYTGATHTRFAHSLGTLRVAQDLLDAVLRQRHGPHKIDDLFEEWEADNKYDPELSRATVLTRLGALLHDLGHVPFGHFIEDDRKILDAHDTNETRFEKLFGALKAEVAESVPADIKVGDPLPDELKEELKHLVLPKWSRTQRDRATEVSTADSQKRARYPWVEDIVGNTICADLLDYLERDYQFTGLPAKFSRRFMDCLYVTGSRTTLYPERVCIHIALGNRVRSDVAEELLGYLRYRYELSEKVLEHHAKVAADAMVGKALEIWSEMVWVDAAHRSRRIRVPTQLVSIDKIQEWIKAKKNGAETLASITEDARDCLEPHFCAKGDDVLIQQLHDLMAAAKEQTAGHKAIVKLPEDVLGRRLFRRRGRSKEADRSNAKEIFDLFGAPGSRRRLEEDAAAYAGIDEPWKVLLWVPPPEMRLKLAEVLVNDGDRITRLQGLSVFGETGFQIAESHRRLWRVSVMVHKSVIKDDWLVVLARLGDKLGVAWEGFSEQPSIDPLAARAVANERNLTSFDEARLLAAASRIEGGASGNGYVGGLLDQAPGAAEPWVLSEAFGPDVAARSVPATSMNRPAPTFAGLLDYFRAVADHEFGPVAEPTLELGKSPDVTTAPEE